MPGTGRDPKTYNTINSVTYDANTNRLILRATAGDGSKFALVMNSWPKPIA
jgi:hypothetical protein